MNDVQIFKNDAHLRELICNYKSCSTATVELTTEPKCTVKSRITKEPYEAIFAGKVFCISRRYVTIGNDYETAVNNRLDKEGKDVEKFEAMSLPWGQWVEGSKILIEHKGETYIRLNYLSANSDKTEKAYYYEDGTMLDDELVERLKEEFLPVDKGETRQGTDNPVIVITTKLAGITRLKFAGKIYVREGYASEEELRAKLASAIELAKKASGKPVHLHDLYSATNSELPRVKSRVRWILTDKTAFKRVGEAQYDVV